METYSALLALCAGNSPVTGEFPAQRPVTRSFDVFVDMHLNERLSKQSWVWWFDTPSRSLWRHYNVREKIVKLMFMAWCKTAVTPSLTHWRYGSLAFSHGYVDFFLFISVVHRWHEQPHPYHVKAVCRLNSALEAINLYIHISSIPPVVRLWVRVSNLDVSLVTTLIHCCIWHLRVVQLYNLKSTFDKGSLSLRKDSGGCHRQNHETEYCIGYLCLYKNA